MVGLGVVSLWPLWVWINAVVWSMYNIVEGSICGWLGATPSTLSSPESSSYSGTEKQSGQQDRHRVAPISASCHHEFAEGFLPGDIHSTLVTVFGAQMVANSGSVAASQRPGRLPLQAASSSPEDLPSSQWSGVRQARQKSAVSVSSTIATNPGERRAQQGRGVRASVPQPLSATADDDAGDLGSKAGEGEASAAIVQLAAAFEALEAGMFVVQDKVALLAQLQHRERHRMWPHEEKGLEDMLD